MVDKIEMQSFASYLLNITGCKTLTELSQRIGVTRATLNNWNKSSVAKLSPETQKKLRDAFANNPHWGVQLGTIKNSTIEIITIGRDAKDSFNKSDQSSQEDSNLIKRVLKENYDLKDEIIMLKEKIQKYEVKK